MSGREKKKKQDCSLSTDNESSFVFRYGPLVVNPRKKPSKTIFTGRHSKDEKLEGEAEVKRRLRRDRNRLAATKYREAREKVLSNLEEELRHNQTTNDELTLYVERLLQRKQQLEFSVSQIMTNHPEPVQSSSEIVHPITSSQTFELVAQDQEQFQMFLTNSNDAGNSNDFHLNYQLQQQEQQQQMTINSSSLNRLLDECVPPINTNNNNNLLLFNSAYGTSTCAQQYSSSSSNEDDSMLSTKRNSYVC